MIYVVTALNENAFLVTVALFALISLKMFINIKLIPFLLMYQWYFDKKYYYNINNNNKNNKYQIIENNSNSKWNKVCNYIINYFSFSGNNNNNKKYVNDSINNHIYYSTINNTITESDPMLSSNYNNLRLSLLQRVTSVSIPNVQLTISNNNNFINNDENIIDDVYINENVQNKNDITGSTDNNVVDNDTDDDISMNYLTLRGTAVMHSLLLIFNNGKINR